MVVNMQNDMGETKSRKPGRPKVDQVKVRQYFYLSEAELRSLQAVAKARQLSVSAIVRAALISQVFLLGKSN
jgi:Ribbon-helix-helix protein, copG family